MSKSTENTRRSSKSHQHHVTVSPRDKIASEGIDMPDQDYYDPNDDFHSEEDLYGGPMNENMDQRVHLAQQRLALIRKEAEDIEREKQALEDLRRKQQGFTQGRGEMMERLSRAVALLDREATDNHRKIEQMRVMRECFADHMEAVHQLAPEDWSRQNLQQELTRALSVIEDAKTEYDRSMVRLQTFTQAPVAPVTAAATASTKPLMPTSFNKATFMQWAFCGFAFTAPLILVVAVLALLKMLF